MVITPSGLVRAVRLLPVLVVACLLASPVAAAAGGHSCDCGKKTPAERAEDLAREPATWAGVGVGVTALAGAWWLGVPRRGLALAVGLYTRLTRDDVLRHPARARVLEAVRARPGTETRGLAHAAAMNEGTLVYHLRALETAGFVKSLRVGRERVWFEAAATKPDASALAALQAPARESLLAAITRTPGLTQAELARALAMPRTTCHHHVAHLRDAGLVECRRDGLRLRCYPTRRADAAGAGGDAATSA